MLRFLIKFLVLSIIVVVSVMLLAQWRLDTELESFTKRAEPFADIKYESAQITYTGEITLNSLEIYVAAADMTLEIGKIRFSVGNLYDLAMFNRNLRNNIIPDKGYLVVKDLLLPFNTKLVKSFEKMNQLSPQQVISWSYCGKTPRFSIGALEGMGYDYIAADSDIYFMLDKYSGSAVINSKMAIEDAFQLEFQVNIGGVIAWLESQQKRAVGEAITDEITPDIALLEIRTIDKGYNNKKAQMCAIKQGVSVEEYYNGHIEAVTKIFEEVGIKPSESFTVLYPESIKPESEVYWFMQPKANFDFAGLTYYSYEELVKLGGLKILVNKQPLDLFSEGWSFQRFQQILVNAQEREKPKKRSVDLYETVSIKKDFRPFASTQASQFIGLKARLKRNDGQLFEGKITKSNDQKLWLTSRSVKGELELPFLHKEIETFEVLVQIN